MKTNILTCPRSHPPRQTLPSVAALLALVMLTACQQPASSTKAPAKTTAAGQMPAAGQTRFVFAVKGMTCRGCADGLQSELARLGGVVSAQVDLSTARAQIIGRSDRLTSDQLAAAIREAGFQPTEIR